MTDWEGMSTARTIAAAAGLGCRKRFGALDASLAIVCLAFTASTLHASTPANPAGQTPDPQAQDSQQSGQTPTGPVIKATTEVVNVYAVVEDKQHRLIPDLTKDNFSLTEDGAPQVIRYFSKATDTPLTIGLLIDTSGSQQRVLPIEQEQAKAFLAQVVRPKDLVFIMHFDLECELLQDLTADRSRLDRAIDETVINAGGGGPTPGTFPTGASAGGTHFYDAVYLAAEDVLKDEVGRKVVIVLSDGEDQGSKLRLEQALEAAQKANIIVYSLDISDRMFYLSRGMGYAGGEVLKKLSEATGGSVIKVNRPQQAAEAFNRIAAELRTQYLLGYTPSDTRHDGSYRKIQVRLTERDYKVQARRGYYAPTE